MKIFILVSFLLAPGMARADAGDCTIGQVTQTCQFYNHETWTKFTYVCMMYEGAPIKMPKCYTSFEAPSDKCSGTVLENTCD